MYVNASLRDPLTPGPASKYESGGATDNVLWIWKVAAPAIDILAPGHLSGRQRPLPQGAGTVQPAGQRAVRARDPRHFGPGARMCFAALGHGAIGWSPFGLDYTKYASQPLGAPRVTEESLAPSR
jgi:hypothetical protein